MVRRRWAWWQWWLGLTGGLYVGVYLVIFLVLGGPAHNVSWARALQRQALLVGVLAVSALAFLALVPLGRLWWRLFQRLRTQLGDRHGPSARPSR